MASQFQFRPEMPPSKLHRTKQESSDVDILPISMGQNNALHAFSLSYANAQPKKIMISQPPIRKTQQSRPPSDFPHLLICPIPTPTPLHTTNPPPLKAQPQPFPSTPTHTPIHTSARPLPTRIDNAIPLPTHTNFFPSHVESNNTWLAHLLGILL